MEDEESIDKRRQRALSRLGMLKEEHGLNDELEDIHFQNFKYAESILEKLSYIPHTVFTDGDEIVIRYKSNLGTVDVAVRSA